MSRNKSIDASFLESLSKMGHFGQVAEDDFETATTEFEERKRKIELEKKEREETIRKDREEEERRNLEDFLFRLEEEKRSRRLQNKSNKTTGFGRGQCLYDYERSSPASAPGYNGFSSVPVPGYNGRQRTHRTPRTTPTQNIHKETPEDSFTIRPYLKERPIKEVEAIISGQLGNLNGGVNMYNNRDIANYFRPEEAEERNKNYSDQHFRESYEELYKRSSPSTSTSTSSRLSPAPSSPSISPPPVHQNYRKKGMRLGIGIKFPEEDLEQNHNDDKPSHITDICGSSARSLVPNGRKFASGPSINSLNASQRIFSNAIAQAVSSTNGEFVYNKDEFPSLSSR